MVSELKFWKGKNMSKAKESKAKMDRFRDLRCRLSLGLSKNWWKILKSERIMMKRSHLSLRKNLRIKADGSLILRADVTQPIKSSISSHRQSHPANLPTTSTLSMAVKPLQFWPLRSHSRCPLISHHFSAISMQYRMYLNLSAQRHLKIIARAPDTKMFIVDWPIQEKSACWRTMRIMRGHGQGSWSLRWRWETRLQGASMKARKTSINLSSRK